MSCMNSTSAASGEPVRDGSAAEPVSEALGSPGRPGWSTGAVGDVADAGGAGSSPEHPATPRPAARQEEGAGRGDGHANFTHEPSHIPIGNFLP